MLSKTKFTRGMNCHKSLWLYVHKKEERYIDETTQSIFTHGTNLGILARQYFPEGKMAMLERYPNFESANRTKQFIAQGVETIFEATFIYNNTLVAVDILKKTKSEWHLFEFKSTTSIKEPHIMDVAVQYYVLSGYGIILNDVFVMHLNPDYIRMGALEIQKLFTYKSVLQEVMKLQENVKKNINTLLQIEKQINEPVIEMGKQCITPYICDFTKYCSNQLNLFSTIFPLEQNIKLKINEEKIETFIRELGDTLYFFDFETIMPGIPMFDKSRPYQQIPFQYSINYRPDKTSNIEHYEYLAKIEGDPRIDFIKQLIENTQKPGLILVYNINFTWTRLKEMQRDFPEYSKALENIVLRLIDIMPVFKNQFDINERKVGKCAIKMALQDFCPDLPFSTLAINNGEDARNSFLRLYGETESEIVNKTRNDLLTYCKMETYTMLKFIEVLERKISL